MNRLQRVYIIAMLLGIAGIVYIKMKGLGLSDVLVGLILGFAGGFLIDAGMREKSLFDNISFAIALAGGLAVFDAYTALTRQIYNVLGRTFVYAIILLSVMVLLFASLDEIKVGRTTRIPLAPAALVVITAMILSMALQPQPVISTRSANFGGNRTTGLDKAYFYVNTTLTESVYQVVPIVNGSKAVTFTSTLTGDVRLGYIFIAIANDTNPIRNIGNYTVYLTLTGTNNTSFEKIELTCFDATGNLFEHISAEFVNITQVGANSFILNITFTIDGIEANALNSAKRVAFHLNWLNDPLTSQITVTISIQKVSEEVLNSSYAYAAILILALAVLLAIPEDLFERTRKVTRKARRRKTRARR